MSQALAVHRSALQQFRAGRRDLALRTLETARAKIGGHAPALSLLGQLLRGAGRPAEALTALEQSLRLDPKQPAAHAEAGAALSALRRLEEAAEAYGRCLALDPDNLTALNNRAAVWNEMLRGAQALADADRALALKPGLQPALRHRARALLQQERLDEALACIDTALAAEETNPDSHAVRAAILNELGRFGDYAQSLERAIALRPDDPNPRFARALARLRGGDFAGGWPDYEGRWKSRVFWSTSRDRAMDAVTRLDLNNTAESLAGQRVLLIPEQGVGDQIMFAGMIPDLAAGAASVTCVAGPRMRALFANSFPGVECLDGPEGLDLDRFDRVVPLGSLGLAYRNALNDFPRAPYLRPRDSVAAAWRERLGPKTTPLRVGLSWRGGTILRQEARSMGLEALGPLLRRDGCEFVSLQYGDVDAEIAAANAVLPRPIRAFPQASTHDFEQLAGLVLALDLVVSVQTAVIHLSGALGSPCLVMTPFVPEWRYGAAGEAMPWYGPSVRLLRQPARGVWGPVIDQVAAELERRHAGR